MHFAFHQTDILQSMPQFVMMLNGPKERTHPVFIDFIHRVIEKREAAAAAVALAAYGTSTSGLTPSDFMVGLLQVEGKPKQVIEGAYRCPPFFFFCCLGLS
jgi:hypothetical protein